MEFYKNVRSMSKPNALEIDECSAWVASNIHEKEVGSGTYAHTEYEYDLMQYEKNEYLRLIGNSEERNTANIDYIAMRTDVDIPEV